MANLQRVRASVADFRRRIQLVVGPEYIEPLYNSMDAGEGANTEARARLRRGLAEIAPALAALDVP